MISENGFLHFAIVVFISSALKIIRNIIKSKYQKTMSTPVYV